MNGIKDHVNQSKLELNNESGAAAVNVATGRLLYEHTDISVGTGSYAVGISRIYDSKSDTDYGLGVGWRLNVQQFLRQDGAEYVYIDGYGYEHEFERYDEADGYEKYFDRTGSGLTLYTGETMYIEDGQGGRAYFENGRLVCTVSAINKRIEQRINYENDRIVSVYDSRTKDRAIKLLYNDNGRLSVLKCAASGRTLYYNYDGDRLISVKETAKSEGRYAVSYDYANKLKYAVATQSKIGFKFDYDASGKAVGISEGVMQTSLKRGGLKPAQYTGIPFSGYEHCGKTEREIVCGVSDGVEFMPNGSGITLAYSPNSTAVTNGKGIVNVYFLNAKGFTTSILEKAGVDSYKSLFKNTEIVLPGSSGEKINGVRATGTGSKYVFLASENKKLQEYLKARNHEENGDCVLSFWAKLPKAQTAPITIELNATCNVHDVRVLDNSSAQYKTDLGESICVLSRATLDHTASGWQYISMLFPVKAVDEYLGRGLLDDGINYCTKKKLRVFRKLKSINFVGLSDGIDIADVHITSALAPYFEIVSSDHYGERIMQPSEIKRVMLYMSDETEQYYTCPSEMFVTETDLFQTAKNEAESPNRFDFICNGGTKRIAKVKRVTFSTDPNDFLFRPTIPDGIKQMSLSGSGRYVSSAFAAYSPNLRYASVAKQNEVAVHNTVEYRLSSGKVTAVCNKTEAFSLDAMSGIEPSTEYTVTDIYGRETERCDAYGVTVKKFYDAYGNLIKTQISGKGITEKLTTEYTYDSNKETLVSVCDGVKTVFYETDPLSGAMNSARLGSAKQELAYNSFNDRLHETRLTVRGEEYGRNTLKYDRCGRLSEIPTADRTYGIKYDAFGRATGFTLSGKTLLEKSYDVANNRITAKYVRSANGVDEITTAYDNYGRITKVTSNGQTAVQTTYESIAESPSCANATKITDGLSGRTAEYRYDAYNNRPTGYSVSENESTVLNVTCIGENKVKYDFDGWTMDFEDEIRYDENCLLSPRVRKNTNNSDYGMEFEYSYDGLGRVSERRNSQKTLHKFPTKINKYKSGTTLRTQIDYDKPGTNGISESVRHGYDANGNVLTSTYNYSRSSSGKSGGMTTQYVYDSANRLVKETNAALHRDLEFGYNPDGSIKYFKENGAKLDYIYSDGKLTQVAFGQLVLESYTYDSFGNPIKFRNKTLEWERGTFLKKYGNIEYTYDINNKLIKKVGDRTHISYYDGDKLIAQKVGDKIIRYFYDDEGVAGFKIGTSDRYTFSKDAQGNILSLCGEKEVVAWYLYNAWGKCRVVDKNNNEITAWDNPAILNPFRWKSQLYDTDTKLYYIDGRWYDPMYGRFISAASPEALLKNAGNVFGFNLYNFSVNPVSIVLPCGSMHPSLDFYYDGEYTTWWERWGRWTLFGIGVAVAVASCIAAAFTCGASSPGVAVGATLANIAISTTVGTAVGLAVNGVVAGLQSAKTGHGFWEGFCNGIAESFADVLVISFFTAAVSSLISNVLNLAVNGSRVGGKVTKTSQTVIHGKPHGSRMHQERIMQEVNNMVKIDDYTDIYLNKSLNTVGLYGSQRPDIIGKMTDGTFKAIEVASKTQVIGSYSGRLLIEKVALMQLNNPSVQFEPIIWLFN